MNGEWLCAVWGVSCVWALRAAVCGLWVYSKVRGASLKIFSGARKNPELRMISHISKNLVGSVDAIQRGVLLKFTVLTRHNMTISQILEERFVV